MNIHNLSVRFFPNFNSFLFNIFSTQMLSNHSSYYQVLKLNILDSVVIYLMLILKNFNNSANNILNFMNDIRAFFIKYKLRIIRRIAFIQIWGIKNISFLFGNRFYHIDSSYFCEKGDTNKKNSNKTINTQTTALIPKPFYKIFIVLFICLFCLFEKINIFTQTGTILWFNNTSSLFGVCLGCLNENLAQGRSYVDANINVSDCFFTRSSQYNGYGGVIYVSGGSFSMNISFSMFYSCFSNNGGAIYFTSITSDIRMICSNRCFASSHHFAWLCTNQFNQVKFLSLSYCSQFAEGNYPIYLKSGDQRVDCTNSSMNHAGMSSGICIDSPSMLSSSHCTFSNNNVSDSICIYLYSYSGNIVFSYANIVNNNSPFQYGIVYVAGDKLKNMMYCIFKKNHNYLFFVNSGPLEVFHSFIDHSLPLFSSNLLVSTSTNNSLKETITYQVQFFNSYYCNADLPLVPPKTIVESPIRSIDSTLGKTNSISNEMTLERTHDQTIKETPYRSYIECIFTMNHAKKKEINVIFSFLYPVSILMIT